MTGVAGFAVTTSRHEHAVDLSPRLLAVATGDRAPWRRHPVDRVGGLTPPPKGANAMRVNTSGCVRSNARFFDPTQKAPAPVWRRR